MTKVNVQPSSHHGRSMGQIGDVIQPIKAWCKAKAVSLFNPSCWICAKLSINQSKTKAIKIIFNVYTF